jgi:hypothetical protein
LPQPVRADQTGTDGAIRITSSPLAGTLAAFGMTFVSA